MNMLSFHEHNYILDLGKITHVSYGKYKKKFKKTGCRREKIQLAESKMTFNDARHRIRDDL